MTTKQIENRVLLLHSDEVLIDSGSAALDLFGSLDYETSIKAFAINREALHPDFFRLRTGLAGDVLQKCSNYHWKLAIYGDFSDFPSGAMRDFITECNRGKDVFYLKDADEATGKLLSLV